MDGSLRVKRCIVVLTSQQKSSSSNEKSEEEQVASSNHITLRECDDSDSDSEIELAETPQKLEDGGQVVLFNGAGTRPDLPLKCEGLGNYFFMLTRPDPQIEDTRKWRGPGSGGCLDPQTQPSGPHHN